jgi:hypothetical protein
MLEKISQLFRRTNQTVSKPLTPEPTVYVNGNLCEMAASARFLEGVQRV